MNCFICTKQAIVDIRHENRNDVQEVRTPQIQENILRKCNQREDELSRSIQGRLQSCHSPVGHPVNPDSGSTFDKLCLRLESEASTVY